MLSDHPPGALTMPRPSALALFQDTSLADRVTEALRERRWRTVVATPDQSSLATLHKMDVSVIVTDEALASSGRAGSVLPYVKRLWPLSGMIVARPPGPISSAARAAWLALGADRIVEQDSGFDPVLDMADHMAATGWGERGRAPDVLLVEDQTAEREALQAALAGRGLAVRACPRAEDALRVMADQRFEAVVTEIFMPGMGGIALLQEVARWPLKVPVIALTGGVQGNPKSLADAMKAASLIGAVATLAKGNDPEPVIEAIKAVIPRWRPKKITVPSPVM